MWIYVPGQPLASALDKLESSWALSLQESGLLPSLMLNAKPMRSRTLPASWKRNAWLRHLSGLTCEPSVMRDSANTWKTSRFGSCAEVILVDPSPSPAGSVAQMTLDIYGPRLLRRLARIGRPSVFSRMSQPTLDLGIPKCEPTFEEWVTELRKDCSRRANLAAAIVGSGCSSSQWQTMSVEDASREGSAEAYLEYINGGRTTQCRLRNQAAMWPTAQAHDLHGPKTPEQIAAMRDRTAAGVSNLNEVAQQWPTAMAADDGHKVTCKSKQSGLIGAAYLFSCPAPENSTDGGKSSPNAPISRPPEAESTNICGRLLPMGSMPGLNPSQDRDAPCISSLAMEVATLRRWAAHNRSSRQYRRSAELPRLNPAFVGWLMGFPSDWTHIEATGSGYMATQLSRWSRRMRGYFCGLICSMGREAADD